MGTLARTVLLNWLIVSHTGLLLISKSWLVSYYVIDSFHENHDFDSPVIFISLKIK